MPSGWTTSGIDWTSVETIRKSRTEDVVRELYLAVNEFDYWIRAFYNPTVYVTNDSGIDRDGRMRTENQYYYIYNTVKDWLTPFADLPSVGKLKNQCCFLDESSSFDPSFTSGNNYSPSLPSGRWFGIKNLDYSAGGNLESLLGVDWAILRDDYRGRIDLDFIKSVYLLLTYNLKISWGNSYKFSGSNYHSIGSINGFLQKNSFLGVRYKRGRVQIYNRFPTPQDAVDDTIDRWNTDSQNNPYFLKIAGSKTTFEEVEIDGDGYFAPGDIGVRFIFEESYISFLGKGYNDIQFDMNKSDYLLKYYGYLRKESGNYRFVNYMPQGDRPIGEGTVIPQVIDKDGIEVIQTTPSAPLILPSLTVPNNDKRNQDIFTDNGIPFLNLNNQEGFLKYYTEDNI